MQQKYTSCIETSLNCSFDDYAIMAGITILESM